MNSIFREIGVYGWDDIEDLILAGIVRKAPVLMMGHSGTAKTYAFARLAQALDRAHRRKGDKGGFPGKYRNAATANIEDMVGYPMPPPVDEMRKTADNGETPEMTFVQSPDSIADAKFLNVDEINRTPPMTQNRWFSLINERKVDGQDLPVENIVGMMNPPDEYEGAEILDRAFGDRFNFLIDVPTYDNMKEEDRIKVAGARLEVGKAGTLESDAVDYGPEISDDTADRLLQVLEKGREEFNRINEKYGEQIIAYTDAMVMSINSTIGDGPVTQAKISGRRTGMIVESIVALNAVTRVKGESDLKVDAFEAFRHSLMHRVIGDDPIQDATIRNAHENFKDLLASPEEALLAELNAINHKSKRVVAAFEKDAPSEIVSEIIQDAHTSYKNQDNAKAIAYSYALMNRLQGVSTEKQQKVGKYILDEMAADAKQLIEASSGRVMDDLDLSPGKDSADQVVELMQMIAEMKDSTFGAVTLALASMTDQLAADSPQRSSVLDDQSDDTKKAQSYSDFIVRINSSHSVLSEFVEIFADL